MKRKCKSCNKIKDIDVFRSERDGELVLKTCRACRTRPKRPTKRDMQEPTIKLSWEQFLVRGEIKY